MRSKLSLQALNKIVIARPKGPKQSLIEESFCIFFMRLLRSARNDRLGLTMIYEK